MSEQNPILKQRPFRNLVGDVYGRWTVLEFAEKRSSHRYWKCRCSCGNIRIVVGKNLRSGISKSCGCLKNEIRISSHTTHGMSKDRTYSSWVAMLGRCKYPSSASFSRYAKRGITICERWNTFANFFADMGRRPLGTSLDRKDNSLGYYAENCRWATQKEQNRNKRNNRFVSLNGKTQCVTDWAAETGIPHQKICDRLNRGWPSELALKP